MAIIKARSVFNINLEYNILPMGLASFARWNALHIFLMLNAHDNHFKACNSVVLQTILSFTCSYGRHLEFLHFESFGL